MKWMKLLFFSLASAVYMYYICSTMESFGFLRSGLTLDLDIAFMAYFTKRQSELWFWWFYLQFKIWVTFGRNWILCFKICQVCAYYTAIFSDEKEERERDMMYVRAYVCKKGSLCIYSGKNENCANY